MNSTSIVRVSVGGAVCALVTVAVVLLLRPSNSSAPQSPRTPETDPVSTSEVHQTPPNPVRIPTVEARSSVAVADSTVLLPSTSAYERTAMVAADAIAKATDVDSIELLERVTKACQIQRMIDLHAEQVAQHSKAATALEVAIQVVVRSRWDAGTVQKLSIDEQPAPPTIPGEIVRSGIKWDVVEQRDVRNVVRFMASDDPQVLKKYDELQALDVNTLNTYKTFLSSL